MKLSEKKAFLGIYSLQKVSVSSFFRNVNLSNIHQICFYYSEKNPNEKRFLSENLNSLKTLSRPNLTDFFERLPFFSESCLATKKLSILV